MKNSNSPETCLRQATRRILTGTIAACAAALVGSHSAHAVTYYWDNLAGAGFGAAGGTWSAPTVSQWSTDITGVAAPGASITTATGDPVNFGTGTAGQGLAAGTITVDTVSAGNMTFGSQSGAIVLSGGTITMTAAETITVNNASDTISSVLAGAATSFTVAGSGTLILDGASTFAGAVTIGNSTSSALTVRASNIQNSGTASSLGTGNIIQLGNTSNTSTLQYTGASAASTNRQIRIGRSNTGSGGANIVNNNADAAHTLTFTNAAFNVAATGVAGFGRTLTLGGSNSGDNDIQGVIVGNTGGTVSLNKTGAGTWVLSGANAYTGNTSVSAGTLKLKNQLAVQSSTLVMNGGALVFDSAVAGNAFTFAALSAATAGVGRDIVLENNAGLPAPVALTVGANNATYAGVLSGAGSLIKAGGGTQTLSGTNTYTGTTTVSAGTLRINGSLDAGSAVSVSSGGTLGGSGTVNGTVTVDTGTGAITGGDGTIGTLSLANLTFSGTGNVNVGTLANYTSAAAVNVTSALTLSGGAGAVTFNLPTTAVVSGTYHLLQFGSGISDTTGFTLGTGPALNARQAGALGFDGAGKFVDYVITGVSPNWTGLQTTEWSTAAIASAKNWTAGGNPTDYLEGDTVTFDDTATGTTVNLSVANVLPTSVVFDNPTKNYTLQGAFGIAGSAPLSKTGDGTLTINNTNTYTGGTTITGGTLVMGHATDTLADSGAVTVNGATAVLSLGANSDTVGAVSLKNGAAITGSGGTLTASSYAVESGSASANLSGGTLTKTTAGTVILTGANSYGATTITLGTLQLGDGTTGHDGTLGTGNVVMSSGSALVFNLFGSVTYGGAIFSASPANGSVTKTGGGTLILTGANGQTGPTTVSGGTLDLTGGRIYANATGQAQVVTVSNGATLKVANFAQSNSAGVSLGNLNQDAARLVVNGGTIQFNTTATNNRAFTVGAGGATLEVASGITWGQTASAINAYAAGATLTLTGDGNGALASTVRGTGVSVVKSGAGTWTLSGANTYTGATTVNAGTLVFAASETLTSLEIADGATVILGAAPPAPAALAFADLAFDEGLIATNGSAAAVPEPGAASLLLAGALGLLARQRRRAG